MERKKQLKLMLSIQLKKDLKSNSHPSNKWQIKCKQYNIAREIKKNKMIKVIYNRKDGEILEHFTSIWK